MINGGIDRLKQLILGQNNIVLHKPGVIYYGKHDLGVVLANELVDLDAIVLVWFVEVMRELEDLVFKQ